MSRAAIRNTNYLVTVTQNSTMVTGILPESFDFSITSDYDTPFASGIVSNERAKLAARSFGVNTTTQAQTAQVWQGSSPIDITIPFVFVADSDPEFEVTQPILALMKLATARTVDTSVVADARFLISPGPKRIIDTNTDTIRGGAVQSVIRRFKFVDQIRLDVGNRWTFKSVVITHVSSVYDTTFDLNGDPMRATVSVSFRTFLTPTGNDLDEIFKVRRT